jgi:phospholipase/lecithinase/hemolysin
MLPRKPHIHNFGSATMRRWFFRLTCAFLLAFNAGLAGAQAYTSIVIIGDSLSDTGNVANLTTAKYTTAGRIPGPVADYTDGRFTDGADTFPYARAYFGVWIEQLAATFPAHPIIKDSLDGGTNYAYGYALTGSGTAELDLSSSPAISVIINNMGQQVSDYLATNPAITNKTLFVVWGGANDILQATSTTTVTDIANAATREIADIQALIAAGATDFLVPNLPPLGAIPQLNGMGATTVAQANQGAQVFNQALAAGLAALPAANPTKTLHLFPLDIYTLFTATIGPPISGGFSNVTASIQENLIVNADTYLFWDGLHPTTAGHHLIALAAAALLGTPVATTTAVTTSTSNANLNSTVTFTVSVTAGSGTAFPMGAVTLSDGTTAIGSASVVQSSSTKATATFTTSTLTAATHTINASFVGVNGFSSSSSSVSQIVTAPAVTAALASSSLTIARGATGTSTITLTAVGGYSGTATFACGTLPAHFTCLFSPPSLAFTGNASQSTTLTIGTSAMAALRMPALPGSSHPGTSPLGDVMLACALFPGIGLFGVAAVRRRRIGSLGGGLLLLGLVCSGGMLLGLSGCSSNNANSNNAAAGTYTVPVNVTASGSTSTLNLTVVVQ